MSRKQKQYHFIYKTVNQVNGKYYIGMHSTDILDDRYLGSGQILWHAIKKYGRENFKRETLEFLPNRISLRNREKEIVNEELLNDLSCMNLRVGGGSGPDEHKLSTREKMRLNNARAFLGKHHNEDTRLRISKQTSISKKGHLVSDETRRKIAISQLGNIHALGHMLSKESKQKISDIKKQNGVSDKQRKFLENLHEKNKKDFLEMRKCLVCEKEFGIKQRNIYQKFCSRSCSAKYNIKNGNRSNEQ